LNKFINENLRFEANADISIARPVTMGECKYENHTIPAGNNLIFNFICHHRDPKNWIDPNSFNPDRFEMNPGPYMFVPFGFGKRMCVGKKFATHLVKIVTAQLVLDLQFEAPRNHVEKSTLLDKLFFPLTEQIIIEDRDASF
jgi:cytochrome P450